MGLDIYGIKKEYLFNAGSYCGFNSFRKMIAKQIHVDLKELQGYGGYKELDKNIPFYELLHHSDCDGILSKEECNNLLKDFRNLIISLRANSKDMEEFIQILQIWEKAVNDVVEGEFDYLEFS